ncbi:MAG: circularly permuted type 2 ATP-grasp protein [Rhodothermia bacterium]|nr:circularly permuted type 2 ATP-grasp protein [Rhodothermia bacterium]
MSEVVSSTLFSDYGLNEAYDEMFAGPGDYRNPYAKIRDRLAELSASDLQHRQRAADVSFLNRGVTFTVYGHEEGTEKIFPYDIVPRVLSGDEWKTISKGLEQRINALNLFLSDIYGAGKIPNDGVIPRHLIYSCAHYRREMRGVRVVPATSDDLERSDLPLSTMPQQYTPEQEAAFEQYRQQ